MINFLCNVDSLTLREKYSIVKKRHHLRLVQILLYLNFVQWASLAKFKIEQNPQQSKVTSLAVTPLAIPIRGVVPKFSPDNIPDYNLTFPTYIHKKWLPIIKEHRYINFNQKYLKKPACATKWDLLEFYDK